MRVTYPHDPERVDKWVGKHASVVQIVCASVVGLSFLAAAVAGFGWMDAWALLIVPGLCIPAGLFWVWSYQEGGGGDNEE